MTKSKSGFIALDHKLPPLGYDKIYSHILWNGKPNSVPVQNFNTPNNSRYEYLRQESVFSHPPGSPPQNVSVPAVPHQNENALENIFNSEIIPVTLLKRQPAHINVWNSYQFSVSHFINELRSLPNLFMNDFDKINFEILLPAEIVSATGSQNQSDLIPTAALSEFGIRFGSWRRIVEKVRDFVSDGAKDWFYGKLDGTQASIILQQKPTDKEYFLIRSVTVDTKTVPDLKYVFAISYRKINSSVTHLRIYKDKLDRLCMINDGRNTVIFANFSNIIHTVLKTSPTPVSNDAFKDLIKVPAQRVYVDDIKGKDEYERLKRYKTNY
jgi:hypothetical protein